MSDSRRQSDNAKHLKTVPVLFDTDIGSDVDDALALGLLLASAEALELVAVFRVCSSDLEGLDEASFAVAWAFGQAMSVDQAIAFALEVDE